MRSSIGEMTGILLVTVAICVVGGMTLLLGGCDRTPVANSPVLAEQQSHTIRYLAKAQRGSIDQPSVWLIEVDGQKFVAVHECGVAPVKDTAPNVVTKTQ